MVGAIGVWNALAERSRLSTGLANEVLITTERGKGGDVEFQGQMLCAGLHR